MIKNIVILGGGFGGLRAALTLSKKIKRHKLHHAYKVILVDRETSHTFTPLLYEIATTSPETASHRTLHSLVAYSFESLFQYTHIQFLHDSVTHINLEKHSIDLLTHISLPFEYLIFALGGETHYFDISGLKNHALPFKTIHDALSIRDAIVSLKKSLRHTLQIIVVGGGATGVELSSEIKEWACELENELPHHCSIEVTLVQGGATILEEFDPHVIKKVQDRLHRLGIHLIHGSPLTEVQYNRITLGNGATIPYDLLIWTGGIRATPLTNTMPFKKERRGRIEIHRGLTCIPEHPDLKFSSHIYAIGDAACVYHPETQASVAQVAPAAIEQGRIAAENIFEEILAREGKKRKIKTLNYVAKKYPYIIPVGGKYAVTKIGPFIISGFLAWMFKGLVELNYFLSIMPAHKAFKIWLKGLKIFIQNDRLG